MAFNPFGKLRKHRKVVMAGMVFVAMVTFVMISGSQKGGDVASAVQDLFRGRSRDSVARLYGRDIGAGELEKLREKREAANFYMLLTTKVAFHDDQRVKKWRDDQRITFSDPRLEPLVENMFAGRSEDPDLKELAERLIRSRDQLFFGGFTSLEGLLDFMIWQHEADRLGIHLSEKDVKKELSRLIVVRARPSVDEQFRQRFSNISGPALMEALGEEIRVHMARGAVEGYDPGTKGRGPAPYSPYDFWQFYREARSENEVALVPVKTDDFLAKVTARPTEQELENLFKQYKDGIFDPEKKEPAFMQPHRVQVEWVSGRPDSPTYKTLGAVYFHLGLPLISDMYLMSEYEQQKFKFEAASWTRPWGNFPNALFEASLNQPANVASMVGMAFGSVRTGAPVFTAPASYQGMATLRETEGRLQRGSTLILLAANPSQFPARVAGAYLTPKDEYLPIAQVKSGLADEARQDLARMLLLTNLQTVRKEIGTKLSKGKPEVEKYLAEAVKKYDLKTGKTKELRDRFRNKIEDDPGLASLKDAYLKPPSEDAQGKKFSELFFTPNGPYFVEFWPKPGWDGRQWGRAEEPFLYWKTENLPARVGSLNNAQVRKDVESAWRLLRARELAQAEAEKLAAQAKGSDIRKLRDLAKQWGDKPVIELPYLARIMRKSTPSPNMPGSYSGPGLTDIPESKVPLATLEMIKKIVDLKENGVTTVVSDKNAATFYVAVLVERIEPSEESFWKVYRDSAPGAPSRDNLIVIFEFERQNSYRAEVMSRLQAEAGLKVTEDGRKNFESRGGSSDD